MAAIGDRCFSLLSEIFTACNESVKFKVDSATAFPDSFQTLHSVSSAGQCPAVPLTLPWAPFPTLQGQHIFFISTAALRCFAPGSAAKPGMKKFAVFNVIFY